MSGFRKCSWRSSPAEVMAIESADLARQEGDSLVFTGAFAGYECLIHYEFRDEELIKGSYYFNESNDAIDAVIYTELQEKLSEKYGAVDERIRWKHPTKRVDIHTVGQLGEAVAAGYLAAYSFWSGPDSSISLALSDDPDSYDAHVLLLYQDLTAEDPAEAEEDYDLL